MDIFELDLLLEVEASVEETDCVEMSFWKEQLSTWLTILHSKALLPDADKIQPASVLGLSLRFTDDVTIARLNQIWRRQDSSTDVLSFPLINQGAIPLPAGEAVELGDIVVSIPTAIKQAADQGHDLRQELRWLVSHGLLHLLGWDHLDEASLANMLQCQKYLLVRSSSAQACGITCGLIKELSDDAS